MTVKNLHSNFHAFADVTLGMHLIHALQITGLSMPYENGYEAHTPRIWVENESGGIFGSFAPVGT
jgi:hypothetical protein